MNEQSNPVTNPLNNEKGFVLAYALMMMLVFSMLGMTLFAGLSARFQTTERQSRRLQQYYLAESGLALVDSLVEGTVSMAMTYADEAAYVKMLFDLEQNPDVLNATYQAAFVEFLSQSLNPEFVHLIETGQFISGYTTPDGQLSKTYTSLELESLDTMPELTVEMTAPLPEFLNDGNLGWLTYQTYEFSVQSSYQNERGYGKTKVQESKLIQDYVVQVPSFSMEELTQHVLVHPVFQSQVIVADQGFLNGTANAMISGTISEGAAASLSATQSIHWNQVSGVIQLGEAGQTQVLVVPKGKNVVIGQAQHALPYPDSMYETLNVDEAFLTEGSVPTYQGLVLVDGDIYLDGNLDFKGSLVATGSVYLMNGAVQTIQHDPQILIEAAALLFAQSEALFNEEGATLVESIGGIPDFVGKVQTPSDWITITLR